jgi:hypothetical protein
VKKQENASHALQFFFSWKIAEKHAQEKEQKNSCNVLRFLLSQQEKEKYASCFVLLYFALYSAREKSTTTQCKAAVGTKG